MDEEYLTKYFRKVGDMVEKEGHDDTKKKLEDLRTIIIGKKWYMLPPDSQLPEEQKRSKSCKHSLLAIVL